MWTKGHYREQCPNTAGASPALDQNIPVQSYSLQTIVIQTVTAFYVVPHSSLMTVQS